ncbi:hypothetical protein BMW23_0452 [Bodo saltans virus]|uniref:Uncharacterized protein n=1 Tax=Bodo saltans virus TaxID=2024608 RepID=A0A2H4UUF5_9VIRU|nr:hypothetical protein QJ851_gp0441 [Bodo saltans virus]ATZ80504.1 hypothetical protein BMW23_0452 [Bodo saltans virus]
MGQSNNKTIYDCDDDDDKEICKYIEKQNKKDDKWFNENLIFKEWIEQQINAGDGYIFKFINRFEFKHKLNFIHTDYLPTSVSNEMKIKYVDILFKNNLLNSNGTETKQFGFIINKKEGELWLETENGKQWINQQTSLDFFPHMHMISWLSTTNGQNWLMTENGKAWLSAFDSSEINFNQYSKRYFKQYFTQYFTQYFKQYFKRYLKQWKSFLNTPVGCYWKNNTKNGKICELTVSIEGLKVYNENLEDYIGKAMYVTNNRKPTNPQDYTNNLRYSKMCKKHEELIRENDKKIKEFKNQIKQLNADIICDVADGIVVNNNIANNNTNNIVERSSTTVT